MVNNNEPEKLRLRNGAQPILWHTWAGGSGLRQHLGLVLAKTAYGHHKFVTWRIASDDGVVWDCSGGHYWQQMAQGFRSYSERREQETPNG